MALVAAAVSLCAVMAVALPSAAPGQPLPGSRNYLMVADPGAQKLFFYSVPDLRMTGQLNDINLGEAPAHGGTIVLPDGRILMNDESRGKTLAVRLNAYGSPKIVNSVDTQLGTEAPWTNVDASFRYYAVAGSDIGADHHKVVNVIDLATFHNHPITLAPNSPTEDLTPYLQGNPLRLSVSQGGAHIVSFALTDVLNGAPFTQLQDVAIGTGTHSGFISPLTHTLGITTSDGLDVLDTSPNGVLGSRVTVPWAADGLTGGRGFRQRLGLDGKHVLNSIGNYPADPAQWPAAKQDLHVTDLVTKTARRIAVGTGTSGRGFADAPTSLRYMPYVLVHPADGPLQDELKIIDVNPGSAHYLAITGTAKIGHMTGGPVSGQPRSGKEQRFAAITPEGRFAFASQGGDGKVVMVDTITMAQRSFATPTALHGGGYLTAFRVGPVGYRNPELMGR